MTVVLPKAILNALNKRIYPLTEVQKLQRKYAGEIPADDLKKAEELDNE